MTLHKVRLETDHTETHSRLLESAVKLFAENGFNGVSVRELCAAADANVAAIQYHFGGKEGLYQAIFATTLDEDEASFALAMDNIAAALLHAKLDKKQIALALEMYINSPFQ